MSEIVPVLWRRDHVYGHCLAKVAQTICSAGGDESLFEAAVKRVDADVFAEPIIVTSSEHRFLEEKQLRDCGCSGTILLEPDGKTLHLQFCCSIPCYEIHR